MTRVRWGVLSTSKFAREKVIPALKQSMYCDVVAISSRSEANARAVADALDIPLAFGSYEALIESPDVDVVYNPLPNHMHVDWSIKAMEAGKHVLCEKPVALTAADAQRLLEAARAHPRLKVMEAFMYRFHPQWVKAHELVTGGGIGELKTVQSFFSYNNLDAQNIRNRADAGGGGLLDIGCYCISLSRFLFQGEPARVCATLQQCDSFQTDILTSAILEFNQGPATFTCATQINRYQRMNAYGTEGRVEIEIPFNAPPDTPCRLWHETREGIQEITFDVCDQYTIEGDLFSRSVLDDTKVPTPLEDAVNNMRVIEAVRQSASTGGWVTP